MRNRFSSPMDGGGGGGRGFDVSLVSHTHTSVFFTRARTLTLHRQQCAQSVRETTGQKEPAPRPTPQQCETAECSQTHTLLGIVTWVFLTIFFINRAAMLRFTLEPTACFNRRTADDKTHTLGVVRGDLVREGCCRPVRATVAGPVPCSSRQLSRSR